MKQKHILKLGMVLLLGAQLLWSTPSMATDYYVDANGGNDTHSGLMPNDAFAGLTHAMRQLQAGDTLYVRSGEYHDVIYLRSTDVYSDGNKYNSGTSGQPIIVKAYQNETPVISTDALIVVEDRSWWVFEGLIFQHSNALRFGRRDDNLTPVNSQCTSTAENITIRGNRFQHGNGSSPGIRIECGRHIKIQSNTFDNLRSRTEGKDTHGIMLFYYASDIAISGNHFIDIGGDGVHLLDKEGAEFTDIVIMDNEFEIQRPYRYRDENGNIVPENQQPFDNVGENAIDIKQGPGPILISKNIIHGFRPTTAGQDATGADGAGIIIHNQARGITISKNNFYNNQIHISITKGSNNNQQPDVDSLVRNNIFDELTDPNTTGDKIPTGLFIVNVSNVRVFNNTFRSQYGDQIDLLGIGNTGLIELSNNAFYNGKIVINGESQTNLVSDYNAWARVSANTSTKELQPGIIGVNGLITDSLHIDPATWEPLEGSPLIDAGSSIGIITSDYNDAPIAGLGHDIGAVEFASSILEKNIKPLVDFNVLQSGIPTLTVYAYEGAVVVSANIRDPNPGDKHYFDWSATDNRLFSITGHDTPEFSFDPQYLDPGLYKLSVTVTDNGLPSESTSAEVLINVAMEYPALSDLEDQDSDGRSDAAEGARDTDQDGIPDYLDAIDNRAVLQGINGVSNHHLLVAEAGVQLKLGATALAAGNASALVTLDNITNFAGIDGGNGASSKKSSDFPGGLYDFVITGLPKAGQPVRIVLPQFTPLPKAAVYRKYIPGVGWQKFVTDGDNKIDSAPGSDGVCPAPGDPSYRNGLHAGDYCIQLTIVDGGPNDTDGTPNGVIRDPGGAEIDSQTSGGSGSSGGGGGGGCTINTSAKIDPVWLFLMLAATAGFIRRRHSQGSSD